MSTPTTTITPIRQEASVQSRRLGVLQQLETPPVAVEEVVDPFVKEKLADRDGVEIESPPQILPILK